MSWDIYGNPLQRGHCEVHPHVHEEYPCSVCLSERRQHDEANRDHQAQHDMILEVEHLKMQRDELLEAMRQTLDMLRVTSHGPSAANKAEEMLHAAICSLGADHSPDAAKMVPGGLPLVTDSCSALMTLEEAIAHADEKAIGNSQCAAQHAQLAKWLTDYRAMLAAAPKHEGGAS